MTRLGKGKTSPSEKAASRVSPLFRERGGIMTAFVGPTEKKQQHLFQGREIETYFIPALHAAALDCRLTLRKNLTTPGVP